MTARECEYQEIMKNFESLDMKYKISREEISELKIENQTLQEENRLLRNGKTFNNNF